LTDLGLAIRRAVDDWKPNAANERLIVNISAGWDPVWGGAADAVKGATGLANAGVTGTPELVLESLAYASCSGALVFAAAGNRTAPYRSSVPETAIYPAAWATLPAPTIQECEALGVSGAKPEAGAPLLHAVGGLDFWGGRLMTSRPGASPMLATLGLNVVRQDPYGAPHHAPTLTGTSMSTAAVSGVAAYLWMQNPNLQSAQLAAQLYRSGQPTAHAANVCFGPTPCSEVRNVVLCGAQGDAAPIGCNPTPPAIEVPASAALELEEPIALELEAAEELLPGTGEQPWVYPQPPDDPSCGVCQFQTQNNKLDIHWIDSFQPSHILQMRIYLNDNSGYWTIPISIAQSKQDFRVTLSGASGETSAGTVRYKYDLGTSVITIEESLVVP
jgi:subtilisin family serine protease